MTQAGALLRKTRAPNHAFGHVDKHPVQRFVRWHSDGGSNIEK